MGVKAATAEDSTLIGTSSSVVKNVSANVGVDAKGTAVTPLHNPSYVCKVPEDVNAESIMSLNHDVSTEMVSETGHAKELDTEASK